MDSYEDLKKLERELKNFKNKIKKLNESIYEELFEGPLRETEDELSYRLEELKSSLRDNPED